MAHVLLIEDDAGVRQGLELALRHQGYRVDAARTGEEGLSKSTVPIIMLTARGDDFDIVGGLEAGADDYVVKPVQPRVLDARIRTVLPASCSS